MKTYLVQTWAKENGALLEQYETNLPNASEVEKLRKFLRRKAGHVLITPRPDKPPSRKR